MNSNLFLAAIGLPGSGKSSVSDQLGRLCDIEVFHEPEESEWPDAVKNREMSGYFGAIMWFRSIRVPLYFKAVEAKKAGKISIVDSYFDKFFYFYVGRKDTEWLIKQDDPYFDLVKEISRRDWDLLPDADCVICFDIDYDDWRELLKMRNRMLDNNPEFLKVYNSKNYLFEAARVFAIEKNAKLVYFKQTISSPAEAAKLLQKRLEVEGIFLKKRRVGVTSE